MARFLSAPEPLPLENDWYWLPEDLIFEFTLREALSPYPPELNELIELGLDPDEVIYAIAPKGFVTDLASIPKVLTPILPRDGSYTKAAIIHDIIYQSLKEYTTIDMSEHRYDPVHLLNVHHTRYLADRIFLLGMECLGTNAIVRKMMFQGVRVGGFASYGVNKMEENYGVDITHDWKASSSYYIFREKPSISIDPSIYLPVVDDTKNVVAVQYPNLKRRLVFFDQD